MIFFIGSFFVFCGRVRFRRETAPPRYFWEINNSRYPALTVTLTSRSREAAYCVPPVMAPRTRSMATCWPALRAKLMLVPRPVPMLAAASLAAVRSFESGT